MLVTASAKEGVVEADESEMLHAVFDFGELVVRQIMVPRTEVFAVEADIPLEDAIDLVSQSTFTKFPVYVENLDQIVGIMHVKDLLQALRSPDTQKRTVRGIMREPIFVPETTPVNSLLRRFRDQRQHIAIVLDEFGGTAGLATLEDLLEEIVGEVKDPFDEMAPEFETLPDGSILVDGMALIDEVNEQMGLELHDPEYDTIAGFVLGKLGRMAGMGDIVEGSGVHLRVVEMDGLRIARLALTRLAPPAVPTQDVVQQDAVQYPAGQKVISPVTKESPNKAASKQVDS